MSKLQSLIANSCATYDRDGMCLLETGANGDRTCVYFREYGGRCSYAENCVIPGDPKIEAIYWAERGAGLTGDICDRCNELFERKSNRQIYCSKCGSEVDKEKRRKRDCEYRERKRRFKD